MVSCGGNGFWIRGEFSLFLFWRVGVESCKIRGRDFKNRGKNFLGF